MSDTIEICNPGISNVRVHAIQSTYQNLCLHQRRRRQRSRPQRVVGHSTWLCDEAAELFTLGVPNPFAPPRGRHGRDSVAPQFHLPQLWNRRRLATQGRN